MDPVGIITILSVALAIYALIPREQRLDLSLRISIVDRMVILASLIAIHYIIYYPVLFKLGYSFDLGSWRYGFTEETLTYLIFLALGIYVFTRIKTATVTRSNIRILGALFEALLFEKKYGELCILIERHLPALTKIENSRTIRNVIAEFLHPAIRLLVQLDQLDQNMEISWIEKHFYSEMKWASNIFKTRDAGKEFASELLRRTLTDKIFVQYISLSKPYLGTQILTLSHRFLIEEFLELYVFSLVENQNSVYYYELENTQSTQGSSRYILSENNKLLYFLFHDIKVGEKLAIYKPVGDKVCEIIEYDKNLVQRYNEPLGIYYEKMRSRCPIYTSIHFFEVMIIESMHQGIRWHMWLYYFPTFLDKILSNLKPTEDVDFESEFPTPFHYLIYHLISVILNWLEEFSSVKNKAPLIMENEALVHDNGSIVKSAVLAIGGMTHKIITNRMLEDRFKRLIITKIMRYVASAKHVNELDQINRLLTQSILKDGFRNRIDMPYLIAFREHFQEIDHMLRHDVTEFSDSLDAVIAPET